MMDLDEIKSAMDAYMKLTSTSFNDFMEIAEEIEVAAGELFITEGRNEYYEYIVMDGICRSYVIDPEGSEVSIAFFWKGEVVSPFVTITKRGVSTMDFQALTDARILRFPAKEFESLMVENLEIRAWGNEVLKKELANKVQKELDLASLTARERLIKFRKNYPPFESLIPHPAIASYLGITTISLSRLRKDTL
jgi:CRP-like cAMP-binding protein